MAGPLPIAAWSWLGCAPPATMAPPAGTALDPATTAPPVHLLAVDSGAPATSTADTSAAGPTAEPGPTWDVGLPVPDRHENHAQVAWDPVDGAYHVVLTDGLYDRPEARVAWTRIDPADGSLREWRILAVDRPANKPALAIDPRGRVVVVYQGHGGGVAYERITPGVAATERRLVQARDDRLAAGNLSVAVTLRPDGVAVVGWYSQIEPGPRAQYVTRLVDDDGRVHDGGVVGPMLDRVHAAPDLDLADDGTALFAWTHHDHRPPRLELSWLDARGVPARTVDLWSQGGHAARPQLAVDPDDGDITATCLGRPDPTVEDQVQVLVVDRAGRPTVAPTAPFTVPAVPAHPTVEPLGGGLVAIAWSEDDDVGGEVWFSLPPSPRPT